MWPEVRGGGLSLWLGQLYAYRANFPSHERKAASSARRGLRGRSHKVGLGWESACQPIKGGAAHIDLFCLATFKADHRSRKHSHAVSVLEALAALPSPPPRNDTRGGGSLAVWRQSVPWGVGAPCAVHGQLVRRRLSIFCHRFLCQGNAHNSMIQHGIRRQLASRTASWPRWESVVG